MDGKIYQFHDGRSTDKTMISLQCALLRCNHYKNFKTKVPFLGLFMSLYIIYMSTVLEEQLLVDKEQFKFQFRGAKNSKFRVILSDRFVH